MLSLTSLAPLPWRASTVRIEWEGKESIGNRQRSHEIGLFVTWRKYALQHIDDFSEHGLKTGVLQDDDLARSDCCSLGGSLKVLWDADDSRRRVVCDLIAFISLCPLRFSRYLTVPKNGGRQGQEVWQNNRYKSIFTTWFGISRKNNVEKSLITLLLHLYRLSLWSSRTSSTYCC